MGFVLRDIGPAGSAASYESPTPQGAGERLVASTVFDPTEIELVKKSERYDIENLKKIDEETGWGEREYAGMTACAQAANMYCEARGSTARVAKHACYKGGAETCAAFCADGNVGDGEAAPMAKRIVPRGRRI